MATSPETFSKVKNLLRQMDQSIDSARSRRLSSAQPIVPPAPAVTAPPNPAPPPIHSIQPAGSNGTPLRARAMARPQYQQRPAV